MVTAQAIPSWQGAYYDRAVGRWLPVEPYAVSPDGLRLAYADYDSPQPGALATTGRVHLVDTSTGGDRILYSGSPTYAIAGFTAAGVYLTQATLTPDGAFFAGLFLLPVTGGAPKAVAGANRAVDRSGWTVLDGAAWGTEFTAGGNPGLGNELVRLDLGTGVVTVVLTESENTAVSMIGFDGAGNPLVTTLFPVSYSSETPTLAQLLAVNSPQHTTVLWHSSDPNPSLPFGPAFDDPRGAWLGGQGGVWLDVNGGVSLIAVPGNSVVGVGGVCQ